MKLIKLKYYLSGFYFNQKYLCNNTVTYCLTQTNPGQYVFAKLQVETWNSVKHLTMVKKLYNVLTHFVTMAYNIIQFKQEIWVFTTHAVKHEPDLHCAIESVLNLFLQCKSTEFCISRNVRLWELHTDVLIYCLDFSSLSGNALRFV